MMIIKNNKKYFIIFSIILISLLLFVLLLTLYINKQNATPDKSNALVNAIDVNNCKQLWLSDAYFVQSSSGFTATQNVLGSRRMIVDTTQPWENEGFLGGYVDTNSNFDGKTYTLWTTTRFQRTNEQNWRASSVFTSNDGINWVRPNLNLVSWNGSTNNNMTGMQNTSRTMFVPTPNLLKNDSTKYTSMVMPLGGFTKNIYKSNDGKVVSQLGSTITHNYYTDGLNQFFYDSKIDKYVIYLRSWKQSLKGQDRNGEDFGRALSRIEVTPANFSTNWGSLSSWARFPSPNPPAINADIVESPLTPLDNNRDIYFGGIMPYQDSNCNGSTQVYLALPDVMNINDKGSEVYLLTSRDNKNWTWVNRNQAYIPKRSGQFDSLHINMAYNYLSVGSKIYQYYTGGNSGHDTSWEKSKLFMGEQRLDGFVSLDSSSTEASLTTKVINFTGNSLSFNSNAKVTGGYIKVEALDENGVLIPGFDLSKSNSITTDSISNQVTWNGKDKLCDLVGRKIKLRIVSKNSKLYSFQFKENGGCTNSSSTPSSISSSTPTTRSVCSKYDFNGDNKVNLLDFVIFKSCFGKSGTEANTTTCKPTDLSNDGKINLRDFIPLKIQIKYYFANNTCKP